MFVGDGVDLDDLYEELFFDELVFGDLVLYGDVVGLVGVDVYGEGVVELDVVDIVGVWFFGEVGEVDCL